MNTIRSFSLIFIIVLIVVQILCAGALRLIPFR